MNTEFKKKPTNSSIFIKIEETSCSVTIDLNHLEKNINLKNILNENCLENLTAPIKKQPGKEKNFDQIKKTNGKNNSQRIIKFQVYKVKGKFCFF